MFALPLQVHAKVAKVRQGRKEKAHRDPNLQGEHTGAPSPCDLGGPLRPLREPEVKIENTISTHNTSDP